MFFTCFELVAAFIGSWLLLLWLDCNVLEDVACDCKWNDRGDEVVSGDIDEGTDELVIELDNDSDEEIWSNSLFAFSVRLRLIIDGEDTLYWVRIQLAGELWISKWAALFRLWLIISMRSSRRKASSSLTLAGESEIPSDCLLVLINEGLRSNVAGRFRRTVGVCVFGDRSGTFGSLRSELLQKLMSSVPLRPLSLAFWADLMGVVEIYAVVLFCNKFKELPTFGEVCCLTKSLLVLLAGFGDC
jgi:hypothetical protein